MERVKDDIPTCRQPHQLPEVLSQAEFAAFLDAMKTLKQRVVLTVDYVAGLRVFEAVRFIAKYPARARAPDAEQDVHAPPRWCRRALPA
jgi:site-specific recombinase XerD